MIVLLLQSLVVYKRVLLLAFGDCDQASLTESLLKNKDLRLKLVITISCLALRKSATYIHSLSPEQNYCLIIYSITQRTYHEAVLAHTGPHGLLPHSGLKLLHPRACPIQPIYYRLYAPSPRQHTTIPRGSQARKQHAHKQQLLARKNGGCRFRSVLYEQMGFLRRRLRLTATLYHQHVHGGRRRVRVTFGLLPCLLRMAL